MMSFRSYVFVLCSLAISGGVCADRPVSFVKDIAPFLQQKCVTCHGPKLAESEYRVDTYNSLMASGISPGSTDESEFLQRLTTSDKDMRMPADSDPLPRHQIDLVRKWIQQGAKFDGKSKSSTLEQLIPNSQHPDPPKVYRSAIPISAIASDGEQVFVGGYHEITVWSLDGKLLRRITDQGQRTYSIDLHPSKSWLLSASGTPGELGEVRLFDLDSGKLVSVIQKASEAIMDARFSADGSKIAIAMPDGSASILDAQSFEETLRLFGHSDMVVALAWHKDGLRLATASRDASAKVFDIEKGQSIATFSGHTECVNDVGFVSDHQLISVSSDGTAQRWRANDGRREHVVIEQKNSPVLGLSVSEKSMLLCGAIPTQQFDRIGNRILRRGDPPADWVTTTAVVPDDAGDTYLLGTQSGRVLVWFSDSEKEVIEFEGFPH